MPTIQPGAKVLVSGANGYIAIWVVQMFLEKGYAVRGTVRSADKGDHLKSLFAKYGDKLEIAIVEDITKDGAFDEAVKGVDAIAHTASPFHLKAQHPDELIVPAVNGTVSILQSALRHGSSVKRVVLLSSCASIFRVSSEPHVYSEKDWNDQAVEAVRTQGEKTPAMEVYRASKTLAEKAAWLFVETHQRQINWDLTVLNPPFVFGPVIHAVSSPSALNTSVQQWFNTVLKPDCGGKSPEALAKTGPAWIDVRDLAEAHVLALEKSEAGGERIIISKGPFAWQDWIDMANTLPESTVAALANPHLPKGNPGIGSRRPNITPLIDYDTSKANKILGLRYRSEEECASDMITDFATRGW